MRQSSKAALGGIVSALSIVIMLCTYISPLLVYTAPPFAGILLILIINELGYKWAFGTFASISLLSVFLIADKESAVFYTMFFGYYPILVLFLQSKIKSKIFKYIIKIIICNIACISAVMVCAFVFNISYDDFSEGGILFTLAFIVLMNILFIVFDFFVLRIQDVYILKLRKKFRKLFNIR